MSGGPRLSFTRVPILLGFLVLLAVLGSFILYGPAEADTTSATWEVVACGSEVSNSLTRKTYVLDGTEGTCVTPSGATKPAYSITGNEPEINSYFDVDAAYMSGTQYPYARIDVEYFDDGYRTEGDTVFRLEYESTSSAYTMHQQSVYLNNTQSYITATFYLDNVKFSDGENSKSDFRISFWNPAAGSPLYLRKVTVTRSQTDLAPSFAGSSAISYRAPGGSENESGLYLVNPPAGHTVKDSQHGRTGTRVAIPPDTSDQARYAFFRVDDSYINQANYKYAAVEFSYFDKGTGNFRIQYDAAGSSHQASEVVYLSNSNQWITQTIYLRNVNFANRQTEAGTGDFRVLFLPDTSGYLLTFDGVTVARSNTDMTPNYGTTPNVSFVSPNHENGLRIITLADNLVTPMLITGTQGTARIATQVSSSGYAFFNVDDSYIYDSSYKHATVQVSYLDRGYGKFYLTYDSNSSTAADSSATQSFDQSIQSHNVAYLTNSQAWKTYTFHLANVKFANRQLVNRADIQLVYSMDTAATTANQGNLLAFDRVTVTRDNTAADRTAAHEGNYSGFGDPVVVWTRLAQVNEEGHGLWQNDSVADGATTASTQGGQQARTNSPGGKIYFDINDAYLKDGNAKNAWIAVEYFDSGTGSFYLEYDSTTGEKASESIARTDTNTWKRYTFYLTDPYFGNRMTGGSDFRVVSQPKDLDIKGVYVERAPGNLVQPRTTSFTGSTFSTSDRLALVYYFPVFDGYYPSLWETSTMGPPGAGSNHILTSYSWRSVATLKADLEDMKAAGIDGLLIWYDGNTADSTYRSVQMMKNLVTAASQVTNPPKIGLLLDSVHFYTESVLRNANGPLDLTTNTGKGFFFKLAEDFYSQLPSDLWLRIGGRPAIMLYYQQQDIVSNYNASTIEHLKERFEVSFGVRPYLLTDRLWDANGSVGVQSDEWVSWGAGNAPSSYPGFANMDTMAVGPGFNDGARVRDRENGNFYSRGWQRAIGKGNHMVIIDTWNYWVEGTAIAESVEYGRAFIDSTAQYVAQFKGGSYASTSQASAVLGSSNTSSGIYLDEISDGQTTPVTVAGVAGRKALGNYMFFSLHDSFTLRAGTPFDITIKYWDAAATNGGVDFFTVEYDGVGGYQNYPPVSTGNTVLIKDQGNSGTWKTVTFSFTDGYFANRLLNANDLRLVAPAGGLIVSEVSVQVPKALVGLANKLYTPLLTRAQSAGW